jgi:Glycosyltransferase sugar-binding region containing DXD motif
MRLFFLHKYGGIYIDLDIECLRSLDFLRHYGWVMPQVSPDVYVAIHRLAGWLTCSLAGCRLIMQMMLSLPLNVYVSVCQRKRCITTPVSWV